MSALAQGDLAVYGVGNHRRRELVRGRPHLNGIDWIEVDADQTTLRVHLLNPLDRRRAHGRWAASIVPGNIRITGGERVTGIVVTAVRNEGTSLEVTVDRPGDWSPYELRVVGPAGGPPAGFDPVLSAIPFSFKSACPTGMDPPDTSAPLPAAGPEPVLDYLTKDYNSFVQLMSDRMSTTLPGWIERNPADLMVTLIELLAYVADHLSYYQDAVATEAYMFTARRRVSLRRHALLLGYQVSEGCSARVFLCFGVDRLTTIKAATGVQADLAVDAPPVYQTLHELCARPEHNAIPLHDWSDEALILAPGSTSATLRPSGEVSLAPGMYLLLEQCPEECPDEGPDEGSKETPGMRSDPAHCQVVRLTGVIEGVDPIDGTPVVEVTWDPDDALAFPLQVSGNRAMARANVALADHGEPMSEQRLVTDGLQPAGQWRPVLRERPLTFAQPYDQQAPASALLNPDPALALPSILLDDGGAIWTPSYDLLGCGPDTPSFVVEVENDRQVRLRFGDGINGRRPGSTVMSATYRRGCGTPGNVNAGAITRFFGTPAAGVVSVVNPLPAAGGQEPDSVNHILRLAPHAHLDSQRAVTEDDYAAVVAGDPAVKTAAGRLRWTGSWYSAFVTVERSGGGALEPDGLADRLRGLLDAKRMAGVDIELAQPVPVPIELALIVSASEGYIAAKVRRRVVDELCPGTLPDGRLGFFHPDNFTMGQPVYLSTIYRAVLAVDGVDAVVATVFRRYGDRSAGGLTDGRILVGPLEVVRLDQDLSLPDRGLLTVEVWGGP